MRTKEKTERKEGGKKNGRRQEYVGFAGWTDEGADAGQNQE